VPSHGTFWAGMCRKFWFMTSNLSQNSHCLQPWHHICCCQTVSYHTKWTNDWCHGVPWDFDGPSVPSHGTFWDGMCWKIWFVTSNLSQNHIVCSHEGVDSPSKILCTKMSASSRNHPDIKKMANNHHTNQLLSAHHNNVQWPILANTPL
jgi:hypothetical protein